jgi:hypothetical protein
MKIKGEWEDKIYRVKTFINELAKVQDNYFENLFEELHHDNFSDEFGSLEDANEWLFDYIFNCSEEVTFEEYLADHGKQIDDIPRTRTKEEIKDNIDGFFNSYEDAEEWWNTYNVGLLNIPRVLLNTYQGLDRLESMIYNIETANS